MSERLGPRTLAREAALTAAVAAALAAALAWLGPPGSDLAAHVYQRGVFLHHGFALWNNFWYAGRYSFVTYSVLYYPLAAVLGIRLLAVASVALAAGAFAVLVGREWERPARWSSRTFAVVWAGMVLGGAFPFALGAALALVALCALQRRAQWRFAVFAVLALAASPLAFLLLVLLLAGVLVARRSEGLRVSFPLIAVATAGALEVALWRVFPDGGHYPYPLSALAAVSVFCVVGAALTWRVERARVLRAIFLVYLAACLAVYVVPSAVGENMTRLRFAAVPVAVLALTLREWRPRPVALVALALAVSWNVTPLAASYAKAESDSASSPAYWRPAIAFLRGHLTPSYRVEAVDTANHWPAVYLPRAGIPLARGWFRQDDFPQNRVLYSPLGPHTYRRWLRSLGVRYVVLTSAPADYSSDGESDLLGSGRSGLSLAFVAPHLFVFEVPKPRPLVTGPGPAHVLFLTETRIAVEVSRPGLYRVAVRYSPYWRLSAGCAAQRKDGMVELVAPRAGRYELAFRVNAERALTTFAGGGGRACASFTGP